MTSPVSILVNIDLAKGPSAIDYRPLITECPIVGFQCVHSAAGATLTITPLRSAEAVIGGTGTGGRLSITTDGNGGLATVSIVNTGSGYSNGPVPITLVDPYGTGGIITVSATGGGLTGASIGATGSRYSGTIQIESGDVIEGVYYNIVPRYLEMTSGSTSALSLIGYKFPYRPYAIY